jgi:hypothetical protein
MTLRRKTLSMLLFLAALTPVRVGFADDPLISEFLASNDSVLADEDGDYSDWIEIHNPGPGTVDLGGSYLTDDADNLTKWQFPSTSLMAGEFLVVFASDKNRTIAGAELHTNFKLNADGEYLALVGPDGATIVDEHAPAFPSQYSDVSYGVHLAPGYWYLSPPTPGAQNTSSTAYSDVSAALDWSHAGGTFATPFMLELTGADANAIRVTLDGSMPTTASPTYAGPIPISGTTWVRARAFEPGKMPGPVASQVYVALAPDVQNFDSNLPLVVIDSFGFDIDSEWDPAQPRPHRPCMAVIVDTAADGRAAILDPADFAGYAGMHVRGHSSASFPKKQYKLETWNEFDEDESVALLGLPAESDWVLYAPYSDKTLMRNALAYKWSNDIGRYAPRVRFVELFLDKNGGAVTANDYAGVYALIEKLKRDSSRIDIVELDPSDIAEPEISGGYIIKKDRLDLGESGFETQYIGRLAYVEPPEDEITPEQAGWLSDWLDAFETALMGPDFASPSNGYRQYIDVGSFIDHHILTELMKNPDGYRLSTYMHKDRGGKLHMGPLWDFNLAMGNCDYSQWQIYTFQMATGWYYEETDVTEPYTWYARLMQDPEFRLQYADRWFDLRENELSAASVLADMDSFWVLLSEAAGRNFDRWQLYVNYNTGIEWDPEPRVWTSILNAWVWPNWYHGTPANPHTYAMEVDWIETWLAGNGTPPGDYSDRLSWIDQNLGVAAPPIFNQDGGHVQSGFVLTMTNPLTSPGTIYYTVNGQDPRVSATDATVLVSSAAAKTALVPTGVIADWNERTFDDGSWPAGHGGVGYETSPSDPVNYVEFIDFDVQSVMYAENATCYIRIPFSVDADDVEGLTSLTLRMRYDDAFVAYLNGEEIAHSAYAPAVPQWNSPATNYRPDGEAIVFEDFDVSAHLDALLVAQPNVLAIQGLNSSPTSSDFLISAELVGNSGVPGDVSSVAMSYSATGPIMLDEPVQIRARILNGAEWSAANEAAFTVGPWPLYINEFMADNDSAIEDPDEPGAYEDWIEIYNDGPATLDLGGMYLTDDLSDPTQYMIPERTTIPAGGYLVFWADDDTEQGAVHTNFKLGKGGEAIGLFDTDANGNTAIDTLIFHQQSTDISEGRAPDGAGCWRYFMAATPGTPNNAAHMPHDVEPDGDVDVDDFAAFATCLTGPNGAAGAGCGIFDADCNGDVSLADFASLQTAVIGF